MRCRGLLRALLASSVPFAGKSIHRIRARLTMDAPAASKVLSATPNTNKRGSSRCNSSPNGLSLAEFHPGIARDWVVAVSSKLLQPTYVAPNSRKLAWWRCSACANQFTKRIDLHVADGGMCPRCHARPPLTPEKTYEPIRNVAHRCRPGNSDSAPEAENANRIKKNISDEGYFSGKETRNLMPMLAKNYEKESAKIAPDELIYVSPKLDGIRCIAAYDSERKEILFFSRSGTLFECCDAKIAPALRFVFELDPKLVLDGELYNDSANLAKGAMLSAKSRGGQEASPIALLTGDFLSNAPRRGKRQRIQPPPRGPTESSPIDFESLTSAIRTMRERRTAAVAALQAQLQYHLFDLLEAGDAAIGSTACFAQRYALLREVLRRAREFHRREIDTYDPSVLRLVPAVPCGKDAVDTLLRAAMRLGYEGVMVRRDSLTGDHAVLAPRSRKQEEKAATGTAAVADGPQTNRKGRIHEKDNKAKALGKGLLVGPPGPLTWEVVMQRLEQAAQVFAEPSTTSQRASRPSGGYAHGQRSGALLKYKVMRDDEFTIVAAVEGKGKWKGALGAFVCRTKDGKHTFTVTPASTDAQKKNMWRCWETAYKGKALTVQYQELTSDGIPRFPVGKCIRGEADGRDWI